MSVLQKFKKALEVASNKPYQPKFVVGDVIFNSKYKIARKVVSIVTHAWDKTGQNTQYQLTDFRKPEYFTDFKEAVKLDAYYNKVDEKMVKVLYGK